MHSGYGEYRQVVAFILSFILFQGFPDVFKNVGPPSDGGTKTVEEARRERTEAKVKSGEAKNGKASHNCNIIYTLINQYG